MTLVPLPKREGFLSAAYHSRLPLLISDTASFWEGIQEIRAYQRGLLKLALCQPGSSIGHKSSGGKSGFSAVCRGSQMGNKMFVQLFNVKNIHFRAQILRLVWVRLSRLRVRGWSGGGKWLFSEIHDHDQSNHDHRVRAWIDQVLVAGMFPVNAGKQSSQLWSSSPHLAPDVL